eukprot:69147_1
MSEEDLDILYYHEPPWASYCHSILCILLIAISIPCCNLFYYSIYEYISRCPCPFRKYNNMSIQNTPTIQSSHQSSPTPNSNTFQIDSSDSSPYTQTQLMVNYIPTSMKITLLISIIFSYTYVLLQTIFSIFRIGVHGILNKLTCRCLGGPVLSYIFICGRLFLYFFFILRAYMIFKDSPMQYKKSKIIGIFIIVILMSQAIGIPLVIISTARSITVYQNEIGGDLCWFYETDPNSNAGTMSLIVHGYGALFDIGFAIFCIYLLINPLFRFIQIDVGRKHNKKNNDLMLLMTRLWILLVIVVISSQMTLIIYLLLPVDFSAILYPLDNVINMYCLFLTFKFNEKYYYKYCCGSNCMRLIFPFVKSMALTEHNFFCCCCTYWCGCNKDKKLKQANFRQSAKQEIELMSS